MTGDDPGKLERFVRAQDRAATFERALDELRRGHKTGHWMWFVFPQIAGLGKSATSQYFAISSLEEAKAYLAHPILGPRLVACCEVLVAGAAARAPEIFGAIDAMKLRSSMTLFLRAAPAEPSFRRVLELHFGGEADPATDELLAGGTTATAAGG
ncbi:MAG TPA: DUF1810 domain-containing protein [Acidimicrobiales bacterium]|nr:DUF1810 domain-containing protein [Acidimicrobiales bacterium]